MAARRPLAVGNAGAPAELVDTDALLVGKTTGVEFGVGCVLAAPSKTALKSWQLPNFSGNVPVVDALGVVNWGDEPNPGEVNFPAFSFVFGNPGAQAHFEPGSLVDRLYVLPDKDGLVALTSDIPTPCPGAIVGFEHYTTTTTIVIGGGECYVDGQLIRYSGTTVSSSRSANTTYHVYLISPGNISRVTTAFAAPYWGNARTRNTGTGRYLFSVRTDASGNYLRQRGTGDGVVEIRFLQNSGLAPLALAIAQNWAAATDVSLATCGAPPGPTRDAIARVVYGGTGLVSRVYAYQGAPGGTGGTWEIVTNVMAAASANTIDIPCDGAPKFRADGESLTLNLVGYRFVR